MPVRARAALVAESALLLCAVALAVLVSDSAQWSSLSVIGLLFAAGLVSDLVGLESKTIRISGEFSAVIIAAAVLGPAPAVAFAVALTLVDHAMVRTGWRKLVGNLAVHATYSLLAGTVLLVAHERLALDRGGIGFAFLVFGAFLLANLVNFFLVAAHVQVVDRAPLGRLFRTVFLPVLPSEMAAATLAAVVVLLYERVGVSALAAMAVALITFQYLLRELLRSQARAEEVSERSRELASLQVGVLTAMIQTLSLRDRMTARHCAAVARYSREIAREAGLSEEEQELVHTAGLLHDIGKFIFPDDILLGNSKLTDEQYEIVKRHPAQGARVVRKIDGYGPIADIILAHHERIDGRGYPHGLAGEAVPVLSRIISVADTYDVMTARDSYREPVPPHEAIAELRRVSGSQLDGRLVELFIRVLERRGIGFQHADDADFEAELAFEARVRNHAAPRAVAA